MPHELQLDQACQRLHLPAGAVLRCHAGRLWLTRETRADPGPSPDIVLLPGQWHRIEAAGVHFLTHLRASGRAVRCSVELPVQGSALRSALRAAFSARQ